MMPTESSPADSVRNDSGGALRTTASATVAEKPGGGLIIVGVDGSDASLDALRWGAAHAELTGFGLQAVVAWSIPATYGVAFGGDDAIDWKTNARESLDEAIFEALGDRGAQIERVVEQGHPSYVLVEASKRADLLVVGSRGHGGFTGLVIGSVSGYVVSHSYCPVTVTRHLSED